ncbi:Zinc finger RING-type [Trinorchestia longiramus]|nr:Zinc finger RING-type [Trinorchestia longiramus]
MPFLSTMSDHSDDEMQHPKQLSTTNRVEEFSSSDESDAPEDSGDESEEDEEEEEEDSESGGLENIKGKKPAKRILTSSDEESKEDCDSEAESPTEGRSSPYTDPCAICLGTLCGPIGTPENCSHCFCLDCILEWAKTNNSCPQDRLNFVKVLVRKRLGGPVVRTEEVSEVQPHDIPHEDEDITCCEVCRRGDREAELLLCDGCDLGYHMSCLRPPLRSVPVQEWFCPACAPPPAAASSDEAQSGIGEELPRPPVSGGRLIPRTRAFEVVRARITRSRITRSRQTITSRGLSSSTGARTTGDSFVMDDEHHQLGRLVSESACERKDPGSNPAADMVDAARNTAWDLGKTTE